VERLVLRDDDSDGAGDLVAGDHVLHGGADAGELGRGGDPSRGKERDES
jgi:hypothetical protein